MPYDNFISYEAVKMDKTEFILRQSDDFLPGLILYFNALNQPEQDSFIAFSITDYSREQIYECSWKCSANTEPVHFGCVKIIFFFGVAVCAGF